MPAKTRYLAKRKMDRMVGNLETFKEHINDILEMGYHKYETQNQALNMIYDAAEELQKFVLRTNDSI